MPVATYVGRRRATGENNLRTHSWIPKRVRTTLESHHNLENVRKVAHCVRRFGLDIAPCQTSGTRVNLELLHGCQVTKTDPTPNPGFPIYQTSSRYCTQASHLIQAKTAYFAAALAPRAALPARRDADPAAPAFGTTVLRGLCATSAFAPTNR